MQQWGSHLAPWLLCSRQTPRSGGTAPPRCRVRAACRRVGAQAAGGQSDGSPCASLAPFGGWLGNGLGTQMPRPLPRRRRHPCSLGSSSSWFAHLKRTSRAQPSKTACAPPNMPAHSHIPGPRAISWSDQVCRLAWEQQAHEGDSCIIGCSPAPPHQGRCGRSSRAARLAACPTPWRAGCPPAAGKAELAAHSVRWGMHASN